MKIMLVINDIDLIGSVLPRWYGFAWRRFDVRKTVLFIIPLNLVLRYAYKIFWRVYYFLKAGGWQSKLDNEYWRGYNDGNTTREQHYDHLARILMGKE